MFKEFVVSGDAHVIEPVDLFKTRLPKHLRDRALWEEEFTHDEPIVPGGHTKFRKLHTIGFDGWTISRYRQFGGPTPDGLPEHILRDMDLDGVDASVMFPNLSLFVLFTDDHELSMAHARVYNDFVADEYLKHKDRMRPTAAIPLTCIADAVAEIERAARLGLQAILLPEIPPEPCWSRLYEPVWAAAEANHMPVFIHVATGGVKVKEGTFRESEECIAENFAGVPPTRTAPRSSAAPWHRSSGSTPARSSRPSSRGRGRQLAWPCRFRAMSVSMSSWPPTSLRRPASSRICRASTP